MTKKKGIASKTKTEALPILERENVLVFRVNRPVTDREFEMIENRLRQQEEKSGINIVLVPNSVDLKEEK